VAPAEHPERVRVALGLTTLNRAISRALEPWAATPRTRLRGLNRLIEAGVDVELMLEEGARLLERAVAETNPRKKPARNLAFAAAAMRYTKYTPIAYIKLK